MLQEDVTIRCHDRQTGSGASTCMMCMLCDSAFTVLVEKANRRSGQNAQADGVMHNSQCCGPVPVHILMFALGLDSSFCPSIFMGTHQDAAQADGKSRVGLAKTRGF